MRGHGGRLGLLLLGGCLLGSGLAAQSTAVNPRSPAMAAGKKLFDQNCAGCHQESGSGVAGTFPPLAGNSHLDSARLVVETIRHGRAGPLTVKGVKYNGTMPPVGAGFSETQTAAVATYIRNAWGNGFGPVSAQQVGDILGPFGRTKPAPPPPSGTTTVVVPSAGKVLPSFSSLGPVQKGGRLFRLNCAPCHDATARGGALVFVGTNAPDLTKVPQAAIPDFIRLGPGPMPPFPKAVFSDSDAAAIAAYVAALRSPPHPGGFSIGFLGPLTEGFFLVVCGLGAAVLLAIWIEWKGRG